MLRPISDGLLEALITYSQQAFGEQVRLTPCRDSSLPNYLSHSFAFACGEIRGIPCMFATPLPPTPRAPGVLARHMEQLERESRRPAVLVLDTLPGRDRQRLVARRVAFIVPFVQAYLPHALVDSRERTRVRGVGHDEHPRVLTPSTQLVLLYALLQEHRCPLFAQELASLLGISTMSASRAFRDLEAADLITRAPDGRPRPANLTSSRGETWQKAKPLLSSPVVSRHLMRASELPAVLDSGLTALAAVSDLASPLARTVAVSRAKWQDLREASLTEPYHKGAAEPGLAIVEVWSYVPEALASGDTVDPLSLYLSLRHENDERIELALEQVLESLPW